MCRLRGSKLTSTLLPDADNAVVGSHTFDLSQEAAVRLSPVFSK